MQGYRASLAECNKRRYYIYFFYIDVRVRVYDHYLCALIDNVFAVLSTKQWSIQCSSRTHDGTILADVFKKMDVDDRSKAHQ